MTNGTNIVKHDKYYDRESEHYFWDTTKKNRKLQNIHFCAGQGSGPGFFHV